MWILYVILAAGALMLMARSARHGPPGLMTMGKSRGKWLEESGSRTKFADVAGVDEAKEELEEVVSFLKTPERYVRLGAKIPRGVLLVGPPGTGKTLLARAVAGEAGVPFMSISGSEFDEMLVGVGAARVRDLFRQAVERAPCIVFIDELDALGRARGSSGLPGSSDDQTLNQLLVEMDGFEENAAIIIMAATNRPEVLDQALLRPGRFDRQVVVPLPDREGREAILNIHGAGIKLAPDVDFHALASRTPGFAGADLANLVNEAALLAARADKDNVGPAEFSRAIDRVVAGLEKKNQLLSDEDKRRVAYHEVGHAFAAKLAGSDDKVHKISIIPRTMGALGFTMQSPDRDKPLVTQKALEAKLVGILGGRAAEEVVFGEASTGAQNDLQQATAIARAMVVDYGMSEKVGPVAVNPRRPSLFLKGMGSPPREVGEHLADTIDEEVRRIVSDALAQGRMLLTDNRKHLDAIATRLIEAEVLEGEELDRLLGAELSA